jgi:hypothetical protein
VKKSQTSSWLGSRAFATASGIAVLVPVFVTPEFPTINIAMGLASLGVAVALSQLGAAGRVLSALGGAIAAGIGVTTIAEYAFGPYGAFEQLLLPDSSSRVLRLMDRPVPLAASMLLLLGTALLGPESTGWHRVRTLCALVVLLMSWALLNGYWLGALKPAGAVSFGSVTLPEAAAFFLSALGVLASRPGCWPASTVCASGVAGLVCRWLLPVAALAPALLGRSLRDPASFEDPHVALSWALYAVLASAGGVALILVLARRIGRLDSERATAASRSF